MGAAISFYAIFSIAPLFILLIGLVRIIFSQQTTHVAITKTLMVSVGNNLANVIQNMIDSAYHVNTNLITTIIGGSVLIIAALSVFSELNNDLDELWTMSVKKPKEENATQTIKHYIKERFIDLGLILMCGFLLLLTVAFTVFISFFHQVLPGFLQNNIQLIPIVNIVMSVIGSTILFSLVYRILPTVKLPWKELLWGAFVTSLLFLIGRFLISWYISAFDETSAYGAAGSVIGLLLWIYYSAQVFFIGASGTFIYSRLYGHLSRHKKQG
jgi:membrane protein